jgi:hypothetical protein
MSLVFHKAQETPQILLLLLPPSPRQTLWPLKIWDTQEAWDKPNREKEIACNKAGNNWKSFNTLNQISSTCTHT